MTFFEKLKEKIKSNSLDLILIFFLLFSIIIYYFKFVKPDREFNESQKYIEDKISTIKREKIFCPPIDETKNIEKELKEYYLKEKVYQEYLIENIKIEVKYPEKFESEIENFYRDLIIYENNKPKFYEELLISFEEDKFFCFSLKNIKYLILGFYTGGIHCCVINKIFAITTEGIKKIKELNFEDFYYISPSSLKFKNSKLYIVMNYYKGYFLGPYINGFEIELPFLIDGENIIFDNLAFKEEYKKKAEELSTRCFKDKISEICIGEVAVNYILAGEKERAWELSKKFFNEFEKKINETREENGLSEIDFYIFKKEIEEIINYLFEQSSR